MFARACVGILVNNRVSCQQNQKQERLIWSDKVTELGWMSSPQRLHQERRLTRCVQGPLLQPDTRVKTIIDSVYVRITLISMQENALLSCEQGTFQSTPVNAAAREGGGSPP